MAFFTSPSCPFHHPLCWTPCRIFSCLLSPVYKVSPSPCRYICTNSSYPCHTARAIKPFFISRILSYSKSAAGMSFKLDVRYPKEGGDISWPPKHMDALSITKSCVIDPEPGKHGWWAVLHRESSKPGIENREALQHVANQGHILFKALQVTPEQWAMAIEKSQLRAKEKEEEIEATWSDFTNKFELPVDVKQWRPKLLELFYLLVEKHSYAEADKEWFDNLDSKISKLRLVVLELQPSLSLDSLDELESVIQERIRLVNEGYENPFTSLYQILGSKATKFMDFEKSLSALRPMITTAPTQAPGGRGLNVHYGITLCADVVSRFLMDGRVYVGVITPKDDKAWAKIPRGKFEYKVTLDKEYGLAQTAESVSDTAFDQFVQQSGAHSPKFELTSDHQQLLNSVDSDWRKTLEQQGYTFYENGIDMTGIRSQETMDELDEMINHSLRLVFGRRFVPDVCTTKNAGYITDLFEIVIDTNKSVSLPFLTLCGGDDAERFLFRPIDEVQMNPRHESIFVEYKERLEQDSRSRCGDVAKSILRKMKQWMRTLVWEI
ncbi:hypothetical protein B0I35DRAFT_365046 [Stachybotrys elegans]|uniref:Uncharacterized protein n=1 Tax=Stachybotrys elegans TaxID=80388 RepID=A0A8K0SCZ0_9HYPO|nr:hypothetical protein B0I35DRAFT_365046 [Stachybotrys elegans]